MATPVDKDRLILAEERIRTLEALIAKLDKESNELGTSVDYEIKLIRMEIEIVKKDIQATRDLVTSANHDATAAASIVSALDDRIRRLELAPALKAQEEQNRLEVEGRALAQNAKQTILNRVVTATVGAILLGIGMVAGKFAEFWK
jgi:hypothetical protein